MADIDEKYDKQIEFLINFGMPSNIVGDLIASGLYFEVNGDVPLNTYWQDARQATMRDEFYLAVNFMISFLGLIRKIEPVNEWRGLFDVAFLFQFKSNIQSIYSIDHLTKKVLLYRCFFHTPYVAFSIKSPIVSFA